MRIELSCGICGKQNNLDLNDKNKTYLIGRDLDSLDARLCTDEKQTLSRIQAYIKWDRNAWRIFDGWPPETVQKQGIGLQHPNSFAGTFIKRGGEYRLLKYKIGEELRIGDEIFFVPTPKADRTALNSWMKQAGADAQAAFYKYDGFVFPADVEYYDGFKYRLKVSADEEAEAKMRANNIFIPKNFSKNIEPGKEHFNYCIGIDIRQSTEADLETQRDHWIPQFNQILNKMLSGYSDYLLILLGDGAYICFLGEREDADVNFTFGRKFLDLLHSYNAANAKKNIPAWKVRLAVDSGKDLLVRVDIAGQKTLNVYGNTITTTARLMSHAKSDGDDIIAGIPFHQEFNNKKFYKMNYKQIPGETTDKNGVLHHYYIYSKIPAK